MIRCGCALVLLSSCVAARQPSCEAQKQARADGAGFALFEEQVLAAPEAMTASVEDLRLADLDGDGRSDLVLNRRTEANLVYVSRGEYCSAFGPFEEVQVEGPPIDVLRDPAAVSLYVADLDGDGRPELVWNVLEGNENLVFTGRFDDGEPLRLRVLGGIPPSEEESVWESYAATVGDVDGDQRADVVWATDTLTQRVLVAFGTQNAELAFEGGLQELDLAEVIPDPGERKDQIRADLFLADADYDGRAELWTNHKRNSPNSIVTAEFDVATRAFDLRPGSVRPGGLWEDYGSMVGDIDGEFGDDIAWFRSTPEISFVLLTLSDQTGLLVNQREDRVDLTPAGAEATATLADLNGDPWSDLLVVARTPDRQEVNVYLGTPDARFGRPDPRYLQPEPAPPDFIQAFALTTPDDPPPQIADLDGDGVNDLVVVRSDAEGVHIQAALSHGAR